MNITNVADLPLCNILAEYVEVGDVLASPQHGPLHIYDVVRGFGWVTMNVASGPATYTVNARVGQVITIHASADRR